MKVESSKQWLKQLGRSSRMWVWLSVFLGFFSGLLLIAEMYCLAHIAYAVYIRHVQRVQLLTYFAVILLLVGIRAMLAYLREQIGFHASASVRQSLRIKILSHVNQLGPVYAGQLSTAHLLSAAMEQVEGLHEFFAFYLPQMSLAVLMPVAILIFIFPVSVVSGVILLICAPLMPLFMILVGMGASSLQQKHFQSLSRMSTQFLDAIQGLVTLKLLGRSREQSKKIFFASDIYRIKTMQVLKVAFLSSGALELFAAGSIALLAIYLGLGFVNRGMGSHLWHINLNLQSALFILLLAPEFFLPLRELGTHYHAKAKAIAAANEIANIFALKLPKANTKDELSWQVPNSISLQFESVTVGYPNKEKPVFDQFNLVVKAGEKLAVLGPSGVGKTTVFNMLLKFIEPSQGVVNVNQNNLSSIVKKNWYQAVSWVGQQAHLFYGTLRDNLLLANPKATDKMLYDTLKQVKLDQFVLKLPKKLDTLIGDKHAGLSGGQAQRLALARAFLKNTPLMLLDEPTASLDSEHEAIIWDSLQQHWKNKTVILLTHRLSHLEKMDRVLTLEGNSKFSLRLPQKDNYFLSFQTKVE